METHLTQNSTRERLEYIFIILLILSGSFLDVSNLLFNISFENWETLHNRCREFKLLGFSILAFKAFTYDQIKLKSLSFMFVIWSSVIIGYNSHQPKNTYAAVTSIPLYALYLWWLIRIYFIKQDYDSREENCKLIEQYQTAGVAYNIFMPVSTFRGLLQILFLPWKNPLYETRLLVARGKTIGVINNKFTELAYSETHVKSLIRKNGRIKPCRNYSNNKVKSLIGKRSRFFFKDCRQLEM